MLVVHCRCGACGLPMHEPFNEFAENLNAAAADYTGDEATRVAIICGNCKQNPEVARARMQDPEPGMPIGAVPLTLANLSFLKATLARQLRGDRIRAGQCQNLARCYEGIGLKEEYQGRADAARARIAQCEQILPILTAALAAAEGGLAAIHAHINEAVGQTLDAGAIPSHLQPAPDLAAVSVNCSGMVTPEPHLWQKVPNFLTVGGYYAYVYGPNCRAYMWDSDKPEMREFFVKAHEELALETWRHYREMIEEATAYQTQEPANVASPEPTDDLCECGHVRREHEEDDLGEPCDVHGCPCDGYSEAP